MPSREAPALLRDTYPIHSASAVLSPSSRHESSHRNGLISYDAPLKSVPSQSYTGRQRSASPGSEMVTLEEFLEESNRLSPPSVSKESEIAHLRCQKTIQSWFRGMGAQENKERQKDPFSYVCDLQRTTESCKMNETVPTTKTRWTFTQHSADLFWCISYGKSGR